MKKNTLRVDIVSDVVCPWCVIGLKNLQKSKTALSKEIKFDIGLKPYELRPQIPSEGIPRKKIINPVEAKIDLSDFFAIKSIILWTDFVHPKVEIRIPIM